MTITIDLTPELVERVRSAAARLGISEQDYIERVIQREGSPPLTEPPLAQGLSTGDWVEQLEAWASAHAPNEAPLSDYAVSRAGIYETEPS